MRSTKDSYLVLGLGASGEAAARLLHERGSDITVVDAASGDEMEKSAAELEAQGIRVILDADSVPKGNYRRCVVSPGIPATSGLIREASGLGCEMLSELEIGYQGCSVPMIGVTGTNGKSTLTKVCAEGLRSMGLRAEAAGNYGTPLSAVALRQHELDWIVIEVSSFQLEWVKEFRPDVGIFLNLQPDHLDRHGDMESYGAVKARIFGPAGKACPGIVHEPLLAKLARWRSERGRWTSFGLRESADIVYLPGRVVDRRGGETGHTYSIEGSAFDNPVMGLTAAAGLAAFAAADLDPKALAKAIRSYEPLDHRMTPVVEKGGVRFVDDSKATNLAALCAGIEMTEGPIRLIAGGRLKESALDSVKVLLANRVNKVYVIGEAAERMKRAWETAVDVCDCYSLERAVELSAREAVAGDTVLLSPGCASFDQFKNYKERGDRFAALVKSLKEETVSL